MEEKPLREDKPAKEEKLEKDNYILLARLAQQTERYDDMLLYVNKII